MRVRALIPHEASLLKRLRLRALAEAPYAFGQSLTEAEARTDAYWESLARGRDGPGGWITLVADELSHAAGLAFGIASEDEPPTGRVAGMWVDPESRGSGVGRVLLEAVIGWARARSLARLELWVTEGNAAAIGLYERAGFYDTGRRDALPSNPALGTIHMARTCPRRGPLRPSRSCRGRAASARRRRRRSCSRGTPSASATTWIARRHDLPRGALARGRVAGGKIAYFPAVQGGMAGGWGFLALAHRGVAPAGILFGRTNPVMIQGLVLAGIPVMHCVEPDPFTVLQSGDRVRLRPARGI